MITELAETLKAYGLRPSPQRLAVFEFIRGSKAHPTVETVFAALRKRMPTLSRTTVYTTMHALAAKGLVTALRAEDEELRYDGDLVPHAHFKCRVCGGFYDVPYPPGVTGSFAALPPGFAAEDEQLVYYGLCKRCAGREAPRGRCNQPNQPTGKKEQEK